MNKLKKICKHCDYFGVGFNFHYKGLEKYHTAIGGLIFILFIICHNYQQQIKLIYLIILL